MWLLNVPPDIRVGKKKQTPVYHHPSLELSFTHKHKVFLQGFNIQFPRDGATVKYERRLSFL